MAPETSILIVCCRSIDLIDAALAGVFALTRGTSSEVPLTDCSQDVTEDFVRARYPAVRIVPTSENLGFAKGNNFLAAKALTTVGTGSSAARAALRGRTPQRRATRRVLSMVAA